LAELISHLGGGGFLAKVDIKHAYRIVPVYPEDRPLLGMKWEGQLSVDSTLLFGLRSAPKGGFFGAGGCTRLRC